MKPELCGIVQQRIPIVTQDGWRLCVRVFESQELNAGAIVLLVFPAMGVPARSYETMARYFTGKAGCRVILVDPRGIGDSGPMPSRQVNHGMAAHLEYDWPSVINWARGCYPAAPLVLLGHSLGGQLSAIYAGGHPDEIDALILLNVTFVHYRNWRFPYSFLLWCYFTMLTVVARLFGYLPGSRLGFRKPIFRQVIQDLARWSRTGRYIGANGYNLEQDMSRVTAPVLAISFSDDRLYAPKKAVDEFANRLTNSPVARWHFSPADLGTRRLGHFHHLRTGQTLWERLERWMAVQVTRAPDPGTSWLNSNKGTIFETRLRSAEAHYRSLHGT